MDAIGIKEKILHEKSVLIKINLSRPAEQNHPRTDANLLSEVIHYVYSNGGTCAIAESANGYLKNNLEQAGLSDIISHYNIEVIDLDFKKLNRLILLEKNITYQNVSIIMEYVLPFLHHLKDLIWYFQIMLSCLLVLFQGVCIR
jgi:uncharacterized protein (DUF362 family)